MQRSPLNALSFCTPSRHHHFAVQFSSADSISGGQPIRHLNQSPVGLFFISHSSRWFSSIFAAVNFLHHRGEDAGEGLAWDRLPIFVWGAVAASIIAFLALRSWRPRYSWWSLAGR